MLRWKGWGEVDVCFMFTPPSLCLLLSWGWTQQPKLCTCEFFCKESREQEHIPLLLMRVKNLEMITRTESSVSGGETWMRDKSSSISGEVYSSIFGLCNIYEDLLLLCPWVADFSNNFSAVQRTKRKKGFWPLRLAVNFLSVSPSRPLPSLMVTVPSWNAELIITAGRNCRGLTTH